MKKILSALIFISLLSTSLIAAEAFKAPDIIFDSKLDSDWSGLLVTKIRTLLKNYGISDPFKLKIDAPITVLDSVVGSYVHPDVRNFVDGIGKAAGLSILGAKTEVTLTGFSYDIKNFKTTLNSSEELQDGLVIASNFYASSIDLKSDKIVLSLIIPVKDKTKSPRIDIEIYGAEINIRKDRIIDFFAKVRIQDKGDHYKLKIKDSDFEKMANAVLADIDSVEIKPGRIVIPDLSLKANDRSLSFNTEKVQNYIKNNEHGLKALLLAQGASLLKKGMGESILKVLEQYKIPKEYWIDSSVIKSQFKIEQFASSLDRNNLEVKMPGDFCTIQKFFALDTNCVNSKVTQESKSRLNSDLHEESVDHMKSLLDHGDASIVASISEDYVNKLLVTTYDAGLWKDTLDEAGVILGPKKVFVRMDQKGESGTLFMDVLYHPSKIERLALGEKQVRFPLVMKVALRIEKHSGVPVIIIRLNSVDLSDETLLRGRADAGLTSNIQHVRLKKKVLKTIRNELAGLKNKDIIELRYPELKGLGLEKVNFMSDGNGRMNALLKLEDFIDEINE